MNIFKIIITMCLMFFISEGVTDKKMLPVMDSGKTYPILNKNKKIYNKKYNPKPFKRTYLSQEKIDKYIKQNINKKLIYAPQKIEEEDIIQVSTLKFYDTYTFKDNWAKSWKDSDVW